MVVRQRRRTFDGIVPDPPDRDPVLAELPVHSDRCQHRVCFRGYRLRTPKRQRRGFVGQQLLSAVILPSLRGGSDMLCRPGECEDRFLHSSLSRGPSHGLGEKVPRVHEAAPVVPLPGPPQTQPLVDCDLPRARSCFAVAPVICRGKVLAATVGAIPDRRCSRRVSCGRANRIVLLLRPKRDVREVLEASG